MHDIQCISIIIPKDVEPINTSSYTPYENYTILKTGIEALNMSKKSLASESNKQLYEELQQSFQSTLNSKEQEYTEHIARINHTLQNTDQEMQIVKDRLSKQLTYENQRIKDEVENALKYKSESYEMMIKSKDNDISNAHQLMYSREKELIELKEQIKHSELSTNIYIDKMVNERMEYEKSKYMDTMKESLEKNSILLKTIADNSSTKTSTEIGIIGENKFFDIAENTFQDFPDFEIIDVHKQINKGDFHLVIKDLTIMVDAKSYKRKVDITQRDKLKNDLKKNKHIHFAWLVSLNTKIDKVDNGIFTLEWISNSQCIVYINQLLNLENPGDILKTIYYLCKDNYTRIMSNEMDSQDIIQMKETHYKLSDKISLLKKRVKEIKLSINGLKNLHDELEGDIVGLLNESTNTVISKYYDSVSTWWGNNLVYSKGESIKSTKIWSQFEKDNVEISKEMDPNTFKDIIRSIVSETDIIKPKTKTGAMDIINYMWNPTSNIEICCKDVEFINVEFN